MTSSPDQQVISGLVEGAIDTHMHTAPGAFPRHDTDFSAARTARDHGMRAIVTKNHHFETASRAMTVRDELGFDVRGGITLNEWVGGLNPHAVDGLAKVDGDVVWMPTITAQNHLANADVQMFEPEEAEKAGITVLDADGDVTADAHEVVERIAEHGFVVGLSHLSPTEAIALVDVATDYGVEEFLVQHPHANFLDYSLDEMRTITDLGATLELHYICTTEMMGHAATVADFRAAVDAVGPENVVMATDGGATANPPAMDQFERFVADMLAAGVPEADVETMVKDTPRRVLDIP
jgi:hypothetical protein